MPPGGLLMLKKEPRSCKQFPDFPCQWKVVDEASTNIHYSSHCDDACECESKFKEFLPACEYSLDQVLQRGFVPIPRVDRVGTWDAHTALLMSCLASIMQFRPEPMDRYLHLFQWHEVADMFHPFCKIVECHSAAADRPLVAVLFRGAKCPWDWQWTRGFDSVSYKPDPHVDLGVGPTHRPANILHNGYCKALNRIWPQLLSLLVDICIARPGLSLYIAGHSFGAALSSLVAVRLASLPRLAMRAGSSCPVEDHVPVLPPATANLVLGAYMRGGCYHFASPPVAKRPVQRALRQHPVFFCDTFDGERNELSRNSTDSLTSGQLFGTARGIRPVVESVKPPPPVPTVFVQTTSPRSGPALSGPRCASSPSDFVPGQMGYTADAVYPRLPAGHLSRHGKPEEHVVKANAASRLGAGHHVIFLGSMFRHVLGRDLFARPFYSPSSATATGLGTVVHMLGDNSLCADARLGGNMWRWLKGQSVAVGRCMQKLSPAPVLSENLCDHSLAKYRHYLRHILEWDDEDMLRFLVHHRHQRSEEE